MSCGCSEAKTEPANTKLLTPFTWFYQALLELHQTAYKKNFLSAKKLSVPVISVGNLSVGGTGKTPIIIELASQLLRHNIKVGILSRGYKRTNSKSCTVVSDGQGNYASLAEAGDEPLMMAKMLPKAVVIVDKDRATAGQKAINDYNCQVLLLDDGFQHWKLQRNCDIVLLDYNNPPWSDNLLPAGRLREMPCALSRASYVIVTKIPQNYDLKKIQQFKELVLSYAPKCKVKMCRFEPSSIHQQIAGKWTDVAIEKLKELPVVAFCGIARSPGFFDLVKELGVKVLNQIAFADHHRYSTQDIQLLEKQLKTTGAEYLVTTRKDLIKLENSAIAPRLLAVNLDIEWLNGPIDAIELLNKLPSLKANAQPVDITN